MDTRNLRVSRSARARLQAVVALAVVLLAWALPASAEETIRWERRQGIAESGGTISRASGASLSAASSVQFLKSGDGYARFVVGDNSSAKVLGLSTAPSNAIGSIAFGVSLDSSGVAKAVEGGALGTTIGSFSVSDEFKIAIESGVAVVRRNGTLVHTFSATPG